MKEAAFDAVRAVARSEGLSQKPQCHITILGTAIGEAIKEKLRTKSPDEHEVVFDRIETLSRETDWSFSPKAEYYTVSKTYPESETGESDERKSIIQLVNMSGAASFYTKLNELLGTSFDAPFPHITLFTTSTREDKKLRGIGIISEEDFRTLSPKRIE